MNDNEMKFDPLTGEPIKKDNQAANEENSNVTETKEQKEETNTVESIATVDQSKDEFIENVQKSSEKKVNNINEGKTNYLFIIVIFAIIFAAIFFLFPIISKHI